MAARAQGQQRVQVANPPLSPAVHVGIGAVSSIVEVTLCQPCVAWKNALQARRLPNSSMHRDATVVAVGLSA